jgi:predicted transcriptional regulator
MGPQRRTSGTLAKEVMEVLLASEEPLTGGEIQARVNERAPGTALLSQTTILTILSRLQSKGLVTRTRTTRAYVYEPVTDRPGLAAREMSRVLDDEPDHRIVLARFVDTLSPQDEQALRQLLAPTSQPQPTDAKKSRSRGRGQDT